MNSIASAVIHEFLRWLGEDRDIAGMCLKDGSITAFRTPGQRAGTVHEFLEHISTHPGFQDHMDTLERQLTESHSSSAGAG